MRVYDGGGWCDVEGTFNRTWAAKKEALRDACATLYIPHELPVVPVVCLDVNVIIASPSLTLRRWSSHGRMCRECLSRAARVYLSQRSHVLSRCFVYPRVSISYAYGNARRVISDLAPHEEHWWCPSRFSPVTPFSQMFHRAFIVIIVIGEFQRGTYAR